MVPQRSFSTSCSVMDLLYRSSALIKMLWMAKRLRYQQRQTIVLPPTTSRRFPIRTCTYQALPRVDNGSVMNEVSMQPCDARGRFHSSLHV